jgi:hypothetical protein
MGGVFENLRIRKGRIMIHRNGLIVATLVILAGLSQGCVGRLIGEGVEAARGGQGDYGEIQPVAGAKNHSALSAYERFELGDVINECGRLMPGEFISRFKAQFAEQLADSDLPRASSGKTLAFNVAIIHYEKAKAADNIFGPLEEVVARVDLVDAESGEVLATGNAVGRTGKSVGLGTKTKAEGLSEALIKWVEDYYPKPEG